MYSIKIPLLYQIKTEFTKIINDFIYVNAGFI